MLNLHLTHHLFRAGITGISGAGEEIAALATEHGLNYRCIGYRQLLREQHDFLRKMGTVKICAQPKVPAVESEMTAPTYQQRDDLRCHRDLTKAAISSAATSRSPVCRWWMIGKLLCLIALCGLFYNTALLSGEPSFLPAVFCVYFYCHVAGHQCRARCLAQRVFSVRHGRTAR